MTFSSWLTSGTVIAMPIVSPSFSAAMNQLRSIDELQLLGVVLEV